MSKTTEIYRNMLTGFRKGLFFVSITRKVSRRSVKGTKRITVPLRKSRSLSVED